MHMMLDRKHQQLSLQHYSLVAREPAVRERRKPDMFRRGCLFFSVPLVSATIREHYSRRAQHCQRRMTGQH